MMCSPHWTLEGQTPPCPIWKFWASRRKKAGFCCHTTAVTSSVCIDIRGQSMAPPKIFISYSHDSLAHEAKVLALANRLRGDGIDAVLDQYETFPPVGWIQWMKRQVRDAQFVLVVCTETYRRRADGDEEPGVGLGAIYESQRIQQLLYDAGGVNERFIPVLLGESERQHIPLDLQSYTHFPSTPKSATRVFTAFSPTSPKFRSRFSARRSRSGKPNQTFEIWSGTRHRAIPSSPGAPRTWRPFAKPSRRPHRQRSHNRQPSAASVESAKRKRPSNMLTVIALTMRPCSGAEPIPTKPCSPVLPLSQI